MAVAMASNMTVKYINTLEYVRRSKSIKDPEDLAAFQIQQIEEGMEAVAQSVKSEIRNETIQNNKELATRDALSLVATDVSVLKSDVSKLKSDVIELKSDVSILKSDVTILKSDVAVLKSDVSVLKSDVAVLKTDVLEIKTEMKDMRFELLKYFVGTTGTILVTLGGLLAHGFHWI